MTYRTDLLRTKNFIFLRLSFSKRMQLFIGEEPIWFDFGFANAGLLYPKRSWSPVPISHWKMHVALNFDEISMKSEMFDNGRISVTSFRYSISSACIGSANLLFMHN